MGVTFPGLFQDLTGAILSVVGDVPVNNEAPTVTSSISQDLPAQSFGGAHNGRVCVCAFIGASVRACCERLRLYGVSKKKKIKYMKMDVVG